MEKYLQLQIESLHIVKMSPLPKLTCRYNIVLIKITDIDKLIVEFRGKRHKIANFEKRGTIWYTYSTPFQELS